MEFLLEGFTFINSILLIAGFILIGIEIAMPGISAPGITGSICLLLSIFFIADTVTEAVLLIFLIVIILAIMFAVIIKVLSQRSFNLVLQENVDAVNAGQSKMIGAQGIAVTDLRPTGFIQVGGKRVEVSSTGRFINKSEAVRVTHTKGRTLFVEPVTEH